MNYNCNGQDCTEMLNCSLCTALYPGTSFCMWDPWEAHGIMGRLKKVKHAWHLPFSSPLWSLVIEICSHARDSRNAWVRRRFVHIENYSWTSYTWKHHKFFTLRTQSVTSDQAYMLENMASNIFRENSAGQMFLKKRLLSHTNCKWMIRFIVVKCDHLCKTWGYQNGDH